jgi:capsular polysaccharide transport system ATP-binding protein
MIHLVNVSKRYQTPAGLKTVLQPVSMTIPSDRRIGVIGRNGSGKSTLLKIIAGVESPDTGHVVRDCRISWPLGLGGGLHQEQTGIENTAFIARVYGADVDAAIRYVRTFSELGDYLRMPVRTYSSGMKAKLNFALSMALDFDCYLVDELTAVGDKTFRQKAQRTFRERAQRAGLLFVSHNDQQVQQFCDIAIVIHQAVIYPFDHVKSAGKFYNEMLARETAG